MTTAPPVSLIGADVARVEGVDKVAGRARYAAEFPFAELAYGAIVQSTIVRGAIAAVDVDATLAQPGVVAVFTHHNAPRLVEAEDPNLLALQDARVHYRGEVVALVVADSPENARAAAVALDVTYETEPHDVTFAPDTDHATDADVDTALGSAPVTVDATYSTPAEHNNPMEPHSSTAMWADGRLTVYDSNQGATGVQRSLAKLFGIERWDVRVLSDHVGGGFGAKGSPRVNIVLAAMASRVLDRPVRVTLTRQQQFSLVGYRTPTAQRVRLGADESGRLLAVDHVAYSQTSTVMDYDEGASDYANAMYGTPVLHTDTHVVALDVPTPRWMRAPGEAPGSFALESAMDELAEACGVDPVELRIRNDTDVHPGERQPFSSRSLVECLRDGAERFGWSGRDPRPAATRDGRWLLGSGVAASMFPAFVAPSTAAVTAEPDGRFTVRITASDIGTGSRTALTQIAADALGVAMERVEVRIGDSDFGPAMIAGGSMGMASWSWAVIKACRELGPAAAPGRSVTVNTRDEVRSQRELARCAFGAQFVEVGVDVDTGEVRVRRMLGGFGVGQVANARTVRSQLIGGMTMGLSMALHEEGVMDPRFGDYANHDLAGYHLATHADVPDIDVFWVDEHDDELGPLGGKGVGEIGIVGTAAAIANAVWHATGVRHRDLPIRPDRVLQSR
ncbi:MAG: xanthine dehydrogenase family protein molybdopterin-binding subunit [Nocardioidaceae bacterium]